MVVSENLMVDCDHALRTARGGDIRLGLKLARMAYRQARRDAEPAGLLLALNTLAICQGTNGAYIEAVATAIDAFHLARRLGDELGAAHALTTLAGAGHDIHESTEVALNMLQQSLTLAAQLNDKSLEVRVRNARAIQLGYLKRFDEADAEFRLALALVTESDGSTPTSLIIGNVANLAVKHVIATPVAPSPNVEPDTAYVAEREALIAAARQAVADAVECAARDQASGSEVRAYFNRGMLCFQCGEYEESLRWLQRSIELAERFHLTSRVVDACIEMGGTLVALGRMDEAIEAYDIAYREASGLRPNRQLAIACERVAGVYAAQGRTREAGHSRTLVGRERAEYDRESAHERKELVRFWQDIEKKTN